MRAAEVVERLREELRGLNEGVINHPYVREAEAGELPIEKIERFVINQLYIVPHDLRSLSIMLSRSVLQDEIDLFKTAVEGDYTALKELRKLAAELGIGEERLYDIIPDAVAYTHYLAWLALYATPGEAAIALVVNLPVWGNAVSRLGRALKERYGIKEIGFFEAFSGDYSWFEQLAYPVIERYADYRKYRRVARTIQAYEKMFWDAIYR
ncbi:MAG: hypothetical protein F7C35_07135 [Desulfurococcales archaeon]|nr:hypothetical protein [Desulfurococcales archaeon]